MARDLIPGKPEVLSDLIFSTFPDFPSCFLFPSYHLALSCIFVLCITLHCFILTRDTESNIYLLVEK